MQITLKKNPQQYMHPYAYSNKFSSPAFKQLGEIG